MSAFVKKILRGLFVFLFCLCFLTACGQGEEKPTASSSQPAQEAKKEEEVPLEYSKQFTIKKLEDGCSLISLKEGHRFVVVPEGKKAPDNLPKDTVVLQQPIKNIYCAATAIVGFFDSLDSLDALPMIGSKRASWTNANITKAMDEGKIVNAGNYKNPDYELLTSKKCPLAIESGMIKHAPEVQTKLEELGIPVLEERTSYEDSPLGRMEWVKLIGCLLGKEEQANKAFEEQKKLVEESREKDTGKTAAFFNVSRGDVIARRTGDYVTKMIELAGGHYIFDKLTNDGKRSSIVHLEMEAFYQGAKDADILFYNNTVGNNVKSLKDLFEKNELFKDFKAVKEGNVWAVSGDMYQDIMMSGQVVKSFHEIFKGSDKDELPYMTRLK